MSQLHLDQSIARVERLVSQLLSLNRAESRSSPRIHAYLDLGALLRSEVEEVRPLAQRKQQSITLQLAQASVLGDEHALAPLVRNLLENAVRYSPCGGSISVTTKIEGDQVRMDIEDSGPGIAEESRERVFDRFQRIVGTGVEGSGLGLAIVKELVDALGGRIVLGSSVRLGGLAATVWLRRHGN